jgi:hypothetical protein
MKVVTRGCDLRGYRLITRPGWTKGSVLRSSTFYLKRNAFRIFFALLFRVTKSIRSLVQSEKILDGLGGEVMGTDILI